MSVYEKLEELKKQRANEHQLYFVNDAYARMEKKQIAELIEALGAARAAARTTERSCKSEITSAKKRLNKYVRAYKMNRQRASALDKKIKTFQTTVRAWNKKHPAAIFEEKQ